MTYILMPEWMTSEVEHIDDTKDEKIFMIRSLPWRTGHYSVFVENWIRNIIKLHRHFLSFEISNEKLL